MNMLNIQNSKYMPSPLPEICAPRSKLLGVIEKAAKKRLVFVSASAGSGKTVSVLLWIEASKRIPAWLGLDGFDNPISVFYRMFCTGILTVQPDNKRMAAILQRPGFNSSPVEHTMEMLGEFDVTGERYVLAMDDFHTITNEEILKTLPFVLRRMPHSFVVFILSRNEPRKPFEDLIAAGSAAVITPASLAFSKEDIVEYYKLLGKSISAKEAKAALESTGGWAIGINAISQSMDYSASDGEELTGNDAGNLERYIEGHIWSEWDEQLKSFMLTSAVLDEMPVALCMEITGREDAGQLLETLRERNAFVTRTDDETYRYHHLFLGFLRSRPGYMTPQRKKHLCAAALYYMKADRPLIARRYAIESGDVKIIADVQYAFSVNRGYHIHEYVSITKSLLLSDSVRELCKKSPVLYIACAYVSWLTGDAPSFERNVDMLRQNMPKILLRHSRFLESAIAVFALDYRTPFAKLIKQASLLPAFSFKSDEMRSSSVSMHMPFLHRSTRDYYELIDRKLHDKLKITYGRLLKDHYEIIMHALSAGLYLEQNRTSEALDEASVAASLLTGKTVKEIHFSVNMHLAFIYYTTGKQRELTTILEETEQYINRHAQFLRPNFLAFTARIKLWDGDVQAAAKWLENYFVTESETLELYCFYRYFTTIRAYAVLGDYAKVKETALRLRQMGKDFNRPQDAAEAGTILALTLWAEGKKTEAGKMMETVLDEMQAHGFIRIIADEGAAVVPVLKKILGKVRSDNYTGTLDPVFVRSVYMAAYSVSKHRQGIITEDPSSTVKLSKQQRAILALYAKGYKRENLPEMTGLSINTIKTHTRLLYEKLGVGNAADAVARARTLNLVD